MTVTAPEGGLLERSTELEAIESALTRAGSGSGGLVLIEGPAGVGKTRLLEEAETRAAGLGLRVLMARCGELEQGVAWGLVRRLLAPTLQERSAEDRAALMADAAGLAAPALGIGSPRDAPVDEEAVSHGLYWLATALAADHPLALLVDDAQWSDDGSLRWLASMSIGLEGIGVALVVTMREGEPGGARRAGVALSSGPDAEVLRPAPLSPPAVERFVAEFLDSNPDPGFAAACHGRSGGNPFLLQELLRELRREGITPSAEGALRLERLRPDAVRRHVLLRLARLEPSATALAQSVAVLGDGATPEGAAAVADLEPAELERAFAALVRADVLTDETPLRFVHPLIRAAVYDELPALERHRRHHQAARLLEAHGAPRENAAGHLLRTDPGREPWVRDLLVEAARDLLSRGAPEDALRLLRRAEGEAVAEGDCDDQLLLLGRAEFAVLGVGGLDGLRRAWEASPTASLRAETALALGRALHAVGNHPEAARVYEQVLSDDLDDEAARRLEDELIYTALQDRSTFPMAQARLMQAAGRLAAGEPASPVVLATLALAAAAAGQMEARDLAEQAIASGELFTEEGAIPLSFAINALLWRDELERACELWDVAITAARRSGSRPWYSFLACFRAHAAWRSGDVPGAEAFARDAVGPAELWDLVPPDPAAYLADALIERGQLDEAERVLDESGYDTSLPERQGYNTLLFTRARLHLARGRQPECVADLRELGRRLEAWTVVNPAAFPWRSMLAEALAGDDQHEARELAAEELARARAAGAPRAIGIALRAGGLVAPDADGLPLLFEAAEVLRGSPALLDRGRALTDLGAALRRAGKRGEARPVLREALDLAHRCGATALEGRAREELRIAGARPRRPAIHGRDALTAAELRIARMAAEGLTNRQIGQALFLTLRTVETHLTSVYRKLGIAARTGLAEALEGQTDAEGPATLASMP